VIDIRTCSVCDEKHWGQGLCKKHYHKQYMKTYNDKNRSVRNRKWYGQNRLYAMEYAKKYYKKIKENKQKLQKGWKKNRIENKHIQRTSWLVWQAIKTGTLKKPVHCMCCLSNRKIQAHHEDYSKPYEVLWLCIKCHSFLHSYLYFKNLKVKL